MSELAEGKIQFPGDPALSGAVVVSTCVDQSANMQRAKLRLEQEKVFEALRNDASPTLSVNGQLAATTSSHGSVWLLGANWDYAEYPHSVGCARDRWSASHGF
jgi:hypothetical protein